MDTKICTKCNETKPISEFRKKAGYKNGVAACKQCERDYANTWNKTQSAKQARKRYWGSDRGKVKSSELSKSPKGRARASRYNNSEKGKAYQRKAREVNKEKIIARDALNNAIKQGRLPKVSTQNCVVCSNVAKEYHHYLGYEPEHWLDVKPYCVQHHRDFDNGR